MAPLARAALLGALHALLVLAAAAEHPNYVIMLSDDMSAIEVDTLVADGSATLSGAVTPTLTRMQQGGTSFAIAWAMPICGPTRGSILTGLYAQVTGWYQNQKPKNDGLGVLYGTFANLAQANGYKTLIAGKWQMTGEPRSYGFDEGCLWNRSDDPNVTTGSLFPEYDAGGGLKNPTANLDGQRSRYWHPFIINNGTLKETGPLVYGPNVVFDCAMEFISRQTALGNKFLVYMPMLLTHSDYDYDNPNGRNTNFLPVPVLDDDGNIIGKEATGSMKRNIEYQDYLVGKLLDHLKNEGQEDKTISIFAADNGSLGYGKRQLIHERATRVPFIFYGPGYIKARKNTRELASLNDVYMTISGFMQPNVTSALPRPQSRDLSRFLQGDASSTFRKWNYAYLEEDRWIRSKQHVLDGAGDLWKCTKPDERSCTLISPVVATQDIKLRSQLRKIKCILEANLDATPTALNQRINCPAPPISIT